jgi:hypothetical protein
MSETLVSHEIAAAHVSHVTSPELPNEDFPAWLLEAPHNKALSALCYTSMLRQISQRIMSFSAVRRSRKYFHSLVSAVFELSSSQES